MSAKNAMKIGFACKWVDLNDAVVQATSFKKTTVRWCNEHPLEVRAKLEGLVEQNCCALDELIRQVSLLEPARRMCRLTSDILPLFTHELGQRHLYKSPGVLNYIQTRLAAAGAAARAANIRLSFHPGQFTVLNTDKLELLQNSMAEVEMHTQLAGWLGATEWHQNGFCINIHGGGRAGGLENLKVAISNLSQEAQNLLTIENDEFSWGTADLVAANLKVPIVLDVHHHWINTGTHLLPDSELWSRVQDGWRGSRPKIHCAMSDAELLVGYEDRLPVLSELLATKKTKSKLRAHSQSAHHLPTIDYFLRFLPTADLMWEGKSKNADQQIIYQRAVEMGFLTPA